MCCYCTALSVDSTDDEHSSSTDNITDDTTDTVYSDLANLLTALQSAHPAGYTLDTCVVNHICSLLLASASRVLTADFIISKESWNRLYYFIAVLLEYLCHRIDYLLMNLVFE